MEHTKHLWRAVLIIVLVVVGYVVVRAAAQHILLPTFGEYGPYRGDALREEMAVATQHGAGVESCSACHDERVADFLDGAHATINCETCHGPLRTHIDFEDVEVFLADPESHEWSNEMVTRQAKDLCIRCHESQAAKPNDFPQVVVLEHLNEMDAENSADVCLDCHDAHGPAM
jgi:hypothetical protein